MFSIGKCRRIICDKSHKTGLLQGGSSFTQLLFYKEEELMKRALKKLLSTVLAACVTMTSVGVVQISAVSVYAASPIAVSDSGGWFESCYVEWQGSSSSYKSYNVYVQKKGASAWTKLDDPLIRQYSDHWRADAVGLAVGTYNMKVVPVDANGEVTADTITTGDLAVTAYDRSGFAFSSASRFGGAGAYETDGTLKSGAKVIYVTPDTAKTVQADIKTSSSGTQTLTGLQAIVTGLQKGLETTPIDIRIVGTIKAADMDAFGSSKEGFQVKGRSAYSNLNLTIEGIGEDSGIHGFGMLVRNAGNVELRNFAVMDCMEDSISLDTDNSNVWIHNLDLYYGQAGSDKDQVKGDGTIDIKGDSQYITVSYNHFFDSGKSSLCGMTSETGPNYITYHHNWFDHSDSRHPRVRTMSVHVYNNYFDGNAKYGVGAAKDSSVFVESNYFENCKHPMLTSLQGSDIMVNEDTGAADFSYKGTFNKENGGVIKAYNNVVIGSDKNEKTGGVEPVYYDATDTSTNGAATQFDAYQVSSRTETVPSSVKALVGGVTYDNFDTKVDLGVKESDITDVNDVPTVVTQYAGRTGGNGGDFPWTFTDADNTDSSVITALKTATVNYKTSIVSIGGAVDGSGMVIDPSISESSSESTTEGSQDTSKDQATESTTSAQVDPSGDISNGTYMIGTSATGGDFNLTTKTGTAYNLNWKFRSIDTDGGRLRDDSSNPSYIKFSTSTPKKITVDYSDKAVYIIGSDGVTYDFGETGSRVVIPAGTYTITGVSTASNATITRMVVENADTTPDPDPTPVLGDADGNGEVNADDVAHILNYVVGKITAVANPDNAEVTGDNVINTSDAYKISKFVKGLIISLS